MEKLLNNKFDPIQRRIFIGSVEIVKGIFSFTKAECVIDPEKILWLDKTKSSNWARVFDSAYLC